MYLMDSQYVRLIILILFYYEAKPDVEYFVIF